MLGVLVLGAWVCGCVGVGCMSARCIGAGCVLGVGVEYRCRLWVLVVGVGCECSVYMLGM